MAWKVGVSWKRPLGGRGVGLGVANGDRRPLGTEKRQRAGHCRRPSPRRRRPGALRGKGDPPPDPTCGAAPSPAGRALSAPRPPCSLARLLLHPSGSQEGQDAGLIIPRGDPGLSSRCRNLAGGRIMWPRITRGLGRLGPPLARIANAVPALSDADTGRRQHRPWGSHAS